MCMISRWIFDCCDREYWTWKPRSCNIPGQRCNRPDRWYLSQTIKVVNIGPCWRCEDARLHQQVFGDRKGKKRMLERDDEEDDRRPIQKGKGKIREGNDESEGSSSSWQSIEVAEMENTSTYATNSASRHVCCHKKEGEDQSNARDSGRHGLRSRSRMEIKRTPSYESADKSVKTSSFAPHTLAPDHQKQSRDDWIPINSHAEPVVRPSKRQGSANFHVDRESRDEVSESSGATNNTSSVYSTSTDNNTYSYDSKSRQDVAHTGRWGQGANLSENEQRIFEELQMTSQHHDFVSEWEQNKYSPESPGSYLESVLNTPSELLPLPLDLSKDQESFTNAPVSDYDTLFAVGQQGHTYK